MHPELRMWQHLISAHFCLTSFDDKCGDSDVKTFAFVSIWNSMCSSLPLTFQTRWVPVTFSARPMLVDASVMVCTPPNAIADPRPLKGRGAAMATCASVSTVPSAVSVSGNGCAQANLAVPSAVPGVRYACSEWSALSVPATKVECV